LKFVEVRKLYKDTIKDIAKNEDNWLDFLKTASWNFKYNFDDQILIYAQKPNATACAEMKEWNEKVKPRRWVNKDTKGIAIFAKEGSQLPLRFVFDVEDTHNYMNTKYKLWKIEQKYESEIIEALEDRFGDITNKDTLENAILETTLNMATDNIQDYISSIEKYKKGTQLEKLEKNEIEPILLQYVWASVTYMIMNRCGIDPDKNIGKTEFENIKFFKNSNLVTILGTAVSDIAEIGLREIAKTIRNLQIEERNQNRTFAETKKQEYYDNEEKTKGGNEYEKQNRIHETGRLSVTEHSNERGENTSWKIRKNEAELLEERKESRIYNNVNEQRIEQTSNRDTERGNENARNDSEEIEETRWTNRRNERERPDEMGGLDEQLQADSRGTDNERFNIQLNLPTEEEQKQRIAEVENTSVFSFTQEMIDYRIQNGSSKVNGKFKIYEQMSKSLSSKDNIEFLKNEYGTGGNGADKFGVSEEHNSKGIKLYIGYEEDSPTLLLTWKDVEKRIRELISDDRYLNSKEKEEYNIWLEKQKQNEKPFQERLYRFLVENNLFDTEKDYRNEEQRIKDIGEQLKDYYETEKIYLYLSGYNKLNDIENMDYYIKELENIKISLELNKIETDKRNLIKRINDFIEINDFDSKEYSYIKEELRNNAMIGLDNQSTIKDIIGNLDIIINKESNYDIIDEAVKIRSSLKELSNEYIYKVGDNVFIGTNEYEIVSITDKKVTVADIKFPLFMEEYEFQDFDKKVQETPYNEHLKSSNRNELEEIEIQDNDQEFLNKMLMSANKDGVETEKVEEKKQAVPVGNELNKLKTEDNIIIPKIKKKRKNKIEYFDLYPEIPLEERNNYKIDDFRLGEGTPKEKYKRNIEAIKVLKKCEEEKRYATPEEQEILANYVGWGSLQEAFNKHNDSWANEYNELKSLLTEKEYNEAKQSTMTAFYTPPIVIEAIYKALENMGLQKGNILEPSCRNW